MPIRHVFQEQMMGQASNITGDSNSVWITKTHYPGGLPLSKTFTSQKMIVIARNPIDVLPSFANLSQLNSHSLETNEQYHVDLPDWWNRWIQNQINNIRENHDRVKKVASSIPTYFMRYEDLKMNPGPALDGLFRFLLDVESLEGTIVEKRIQEVTAAGFATKSAYRLKSTSSNLSRQKHMYTEAQLQAMAEGLSEYISFWKYDQSSVEDTVVTNFFDSPVNAEVQNFETYNEVETLPLCGQLLSSFNSNSSTKNTTYEFNMVKANLKF